MLDWNAGKVRNLAGTEIWLFIVARVLVGFGLGILSVHYFTGFANPLGLPALVMGLILFLVAGEGAVAEKNRLELQNARSDKRWKCWPFTLIIIVCLRRAGPA